MHHPSRKLRGFTLVELLVVIAIIATLAALLLPAIGRAREMGRRTTCTSNLYQIAIGMSRYNDTAGYLPGWRNQLSANVFPSWPVMILPQIDRNDVYKTWIAGTPTAPAISTFVCPSATPDDASAPTLAYAGICTTGSMGDAVMTNNPQANTGFRTALDDIAARDGTTTTLLLAEKCGAEVTGRRWNVWDVSPSPATPLNDPQTCGIALNNSMTVPTSTTRVVNNRDYPDLPSTVHLGGFVAVFCDGHTAFIKETVAPHVFTQAMTPNSTWNGTTYSTNSAWVRNWLQTGPTPYTLSEADLQ
jgi:prepilin-type N-terminal cleavage/methylation domain-containing protein